MRGWLMKMVVLAMLLAAGGASLQAEETIVFFRHGEKPSGGLGQLTCQGLNRALALPDVLRRKFGTPDYLYAPNPAVKISDPAGSFYYVRPLATIEPVAIRAGRSVNSQVRLQRRHRASQRPRDVVEGRRHGIRLLGARVPGEGGSEHHERVRRWRHRSRMDHR